MSSLYTSKGFVKVSPNTYFLDARSTQTSHNGEAPEVIVILAWMDAIPQHILKYSDIYKGLYPSASQVVVQTNYNFFLTRKYNQQAQIRPLAELLTTLGVVSTSESSGPQPHTLIHVFSNGGVACLITLASLFPPSTPTNEGSRTALIFDSNPGKARFREALNAFLAPFRNILIRALIASVLSVVLVLFKIYYHIIGAKFLVDLGWETVPTATIGGLPFVGLKTRRLYMHGMKDVMIRSSDVIENVEIARKNGLDVERIVFEEGPHVALARTDPTRYWDAVKALVLATFRS